MVGNVNQWPKWESQTVFDKNLAFNGATGGGDRDRER